jgi:hypothetical protein
MSNKKGFTLTSMNNPQLVKIYRVRFAKTVNKIYMKSREYLLSGAVLTKLKVGRCLNIEHSLKKLAK